MKEKKTNRIFLSPPHMGGKELNFIKEAFDTNYIAPLGPMVEAFEKEFGEKIGIKYTLAVSSGTAALHLALRVLGVGEGDEVIASSLTFIGSIAPILYQGAIPVFIDSDRFTWNMDPDLLKEELDKCDKQGKLPKAVIPTDLYGQCSDVDRILEICKPFSIPVVADSAEALGALYKGRSAGVGALAAIYSFNGNKIITTSGGGILASEDKEIVEEARFLSQQARDNAPHYEHSTIGYNYRMSSIAAAIGRGQLDLLDQRVKARRRIYQYYEKSLGDFPGIEFMPEAPYGRSNRWLTVILITPEEFGADRENVRLALEAQNIEARPVWKPMHLQPVFQVEGRMAQCARRKAENSKPTYKAKVVGGEVAEDLFDRGLCLPSGTALTEDDLNRVIDIIMGCRR